jgi:hypothetical protein
MNAEAREEIARRYTMSTTVEEAESFKLFYKQMDPLIVIMWYQALLAFENWPMAIHLYMALPCVRAQSIKPQYEWISFLPQS